MLFAAGGGGILNAGPDEDIPPFDFVQGRTTAISVVANDKETPPTVTTAAKRVTSTMDMLYTEAFLDPANWRDGSYDEVWLLFVDDASAAAEQDAPTLTAGPDGGDTYTRIATPKGRIEVRILLDDQDRAATAVALVRFSAIGSRRDGKQTLFRSVGQYFLRPGGDGWQVYSFSVDRDDHLREAPSPTASGSATAS